VLFAAPVEVEEAAGTPLLAPPAFAEPAPAAGGEATPARPLPAPLRPPGPAQPSEPPPSIALARLYLQQQATDEAVRVLERLLEQEPGDTEAADLLALVHDMMTPLPAAPPPLSPRERKIAALQRFLASLTLGWEKAAR